MSPFQPYSPASPADPLPRSRSLLVPRRFATAAFSAIVLILFTSGAAAQFGGKAGGGAHVDPGGGPGIDPGPTVHATPPNETVRKQADFNGDGYADIAIGAPGDDLPFNPAPGGFVSDAGVVHIVYGSGGGLQPFKGNALLHRPNEFANSFAPTPYARFGSALAWGDFNNDGYDDLAVGVPGDKNHEGAVDIYLGSSLGLFSRPEKIWRPATLRISGSYGFGFALAAGDINGDGYMDLAISKYYGTGGGGLVILYGGSTGLTANSSQVFNYFTIYGPSCLALADFDGDKFADLAMGLPFEFGHGGAVLVARGTVYGLDSNPQIWTQDSPGIPGIVEDGDLFGAALAVADFNRDGYWDLAVGAPGENKNIGVAHVIFGTSRGLNAYGNQIWSQDDPTVQDEGEEGDRFGASLIAGNFNGDLFPELAVGVPGENEAAGAVHVLTIVTGPFGAGHQFWSQESPDVLGGSEKGDEFGASLVAGNYDGSARDDLAIGVPGEDHGEKSEIPNAGAVNVLYSTIDGLGSTYNQILMQGFDGMAETAEAYDGFGSL